MKGQLDSEQHHGQLGLGVGGERAVASSLELGGVEIQAPHALSDLSDRIADAKLDAVDVREGLTRVTHATFAAAGKYRALAHAAKDTAAAEAVDRQVGEPSEPCSSVAARTAHCAATSPRGPRSTSTPGYYRAR